MIRPSARFHYAWVIMAITFVVIVITAGIRAAPGVLIVPLEEEFHWSRATISFAVGVNLLLYGAIGLPVTPRKTTGYLIVPAATASLPLAMTSSQVCGAPFL